MPRHTDSAWTEMFSAIVKKIRQYSLGLWAGLEASSRRRVRRRRMPVGLVLR